MSLVFPLEVEGQCSQGLHKAMRYLLARLLAASWACSLRRRALLGGGRGGGVPPELMSLASTLGCPPLLKEEVAWLCIEFPPFRQCAPGSELGNPSLEVGQGTTQSGKKLMGRGLGSSWCPLCVVHVWGAGPRGLKLRVRAFSIQEATLRLFQQHNIHTSAAPQPPGWLWFRAAPEGFSQHSNSVYSKALVQPDPVNRPCTSLLDGNT